MKKAENKKPKSRTLDRSLDIIEIFTFQDPELTLVDISERTGISLSTVHRIVQTLMLRDYISKDLSSGKYKLGMQFVRLGGIVINEFDLVKRAVPYLQNLSKKSNFNVNLSIYDKGEALCLCNIESFRNFGQRISVGQRTPIYGGALAKTIFAYLSPKEINSIIEKDLQAFTSNTIAKKEDIVNELGTIRRKGYSESEGELVSGVVAIAAPIRNYENMVIAGISVSAPTHIFNEDERKTYVDDLINCAYEISKEFGFRSQSILDKRE